MMRTVRSRLALTATTLLTILVGLIGWLGAFDAPRGEVLLSVLGTVALFWAATAALLTVWEMQDSRVEDRRAWLDFRREFAPVRGLPEEYFVVRNLGRATAWNVVLNLWAKDADELEFVPLGMDEDFSMPGDVAGGEKRLAPTGRQKLFLPLDKGPLVLEVAYRDGLSERVHYYLEFDDRGVDGHGSPRRLRSFRRGEGKKAAALRERMRGLASKYDLKGAGVAIKVVDRVERLGIGLTGQGGTYRFLGSFPKRSPLGEIMTRIEPELEQALREGEGSWRDSEGEVDIL